MKVAIISFGHADSAIPMAKALSKKVETELFFVFSPGNRTNNFAHYEKAPKQYGLQSEEHTQKVFPEEVWNYIDGQFKMHSFVFKSLKIKSLNNWKLAWTLSRILQKFDVIHFNGKSLFTFALNIFLPTRKFIYTIHDLENHSGETAKNILARKYNHIILKSGNHIVIQNKSDFQLVINNYPRHRKKLHFIPFGVLEIYQSYNYKDIDVPASDIIFFGRISSYKGIEYFVAAVKKLKSDFPDVKAVIAGSGEFYFDISDIKNDSSFHIINKYIENDELVALINNSKIVVCPYIDATQSGVAMTSFVFNKPVIATNIGGFADVIEDGKNGFLVPVKDADAIYEKANLLLNHPDKLDAMNKYIQKQKETGETAWNTIAEKYYQVYKQLS